MQRACFYEIANHAKINGAKGVSLIAGNILCKTVEMHSVGSSACSYADVRCAFIKRKTQPVAESEEVHISVAADLPTLAQTCLADLPTLA